MGGKKIVLSGGTKQQRMVDRKKLGSLKDNKISEKALCRYTAAVRLFNDYCILSFGKVADDNDILEQYLCEYVEHLWAEGEGRNLAGDTISGTQHFLRTRGIF